MFGGFDFEIAPAAAGTRGFAKHSQFGFPGAFELAATLPGPAGSNEDRLLA